MADLLVDTDVFVEHLRGAQELTRGADSIAYSVITRAELFAGNGREEDQVERLLGPFLEFEVDREVAEFGGRLRREGGMLLPDALIAATAVVHNLTLTTHNTRQFESVPDLDLRAPGSPTPA